MHEIFPFKYFDPLRKRWVPGRYKATREEIAARYEKWEITGPGWTPSDMGGGTAARPISAHRRARKHPIF